MRYWPNGLGETLGDVFSTSSPLYASGNVWFVNSATGTDAGGTAGQDREKPLATLGQAVTNVSAGDIVLLERGHTETITFSIGIGAQIIIVGGGSVNGIPSVSLTPNASITVSLINFTTLGCEIRNVRFRESINAPATKLRMSVASGRAIGCYFDMGPVDLDGIATTVGSTFCRIENCTFRSTATDQALRPRAGINFNTGAGADIAIQNCTFDDGKVGFTSGAMNLGAHARLRVINPTFLNGADMTQAGTPTSSYIAGLVQGGGGKVDF